MRPRFVSVRAALSIITVAAACGPEQTSDPVRDVFAATVHVPGFGTPVVFRFPGERDGSPRLYRLPDLEEIAWPFESGDSPVRSVVGFASDRDEVYVVTRAAELAALDLGTGRMRTVDSSVVLAVVGPTGTPFAVHQDGSVASVALRSLAPWPSGFDRVPERIWGSVREHLVAVLESDSSRTLVQAASGQSPIAQPLPGERVAVSAWADAAAVITGSAVVLLDPDDPAARTRFETDPAPLLADFSASGHRLHIVRTDGALIAVDRFSLEQLEDLRLPGTPTASRVDPWGRWQLLRSPDDSTVWVVDVVSWTLVDSTTGEWDADLPLVAPDGTILIRRGDRVAAVTPGDSATASIQAAPSDRWISMGWDPSRPALAASDPDTPEPTQPGQLIYVQVSSTSNPDWAADLAGNLRRAGMPASVLSPEAPAEPFRVVLGPYPNREEAEATGRQLKVPFWIFTRDTLSTRR
jgi:hypothetical protein